MRREQITVPLDAELRAFVERRAAQEDRTVASLVRHILAETARRAQGQQAEQGA